MAKTRVASVVEAPVEAAPELVAELEPVPVEVVPTVEFDVWFAMRSKQIPPQHLKEILQADFKGRGLSANETLEVFDKALVAYGVKL